METSSSGREDMSVCVVAGCDGSCPLCRAARLRPAAFYTQEQAVTILRPQALCETRNGDLAFSLGRLRLHRGRPMLVEHLGGLLLAHSLCGRVLTSGYDDTFDIMHVFAEEGAGS